MLISETVGTWLRRLGFSFLEQFFDMANAFPSVSLEELDRKAVLMSEGLAHERSVLMERHHQATVTITTCDTESVTFRQKTGNLQGDSIAAKEFVNAYEPKVQQVTEKSRAFTTGILVKNIFDTEQVLDCSMVQFANDLSKNALFSASQIQPF